MQKCTFELSASIIHSAGRVFYIMLLPHFNLLTSGLGKEGGWWRPHWSQGILDPKTHTSGFPYPITPACRLYNNCLKVISNKTPISNIYSNKYICIVIIHPIALVNVYFIEAQKNNEYKKTGPNNKLRGMFLSFFSNY